jgi:acyl-CoA synthetase (AMP-forming)/AMP-acid ligase II
MPFADHGCYFNSIALLIRRDQFVLQEDGYGQIVGRLKDIIIRIGDKIFPKEIEDFFMELPDVVEAQVKHSITRYFPFKANVFPVTLTVSRRHFKKQVLRAAQRILTIFFSCVL